MISSEDTIHTVIFWLYKPSMGSGPEDSNLFVLHDTTPHDAARPRDVWLQKVERFRRYPDNAWRTTRRADSNIPQPYNKQKRKKNKQTNKKPPNHM